MKQEQQFFCLIIIERRQAYSRGLVWYRSVPVPYATGTKTNDRHNVGFVHFWQRFKKLKIENFQILLKFKNFIYCYFSEF